MANTDKPKSEPESPLERLVELAEAQAKEITTLTERLAKLESRQTQFVPMKPLRGRRERTYVPRQELLGRSMKGLTSEGQSFDSGGGGLDDPKNIAKLPPEYRPAFRQGDLVQLNPEAVIHGTATEEQPNGRTWGSLLEKLRSDGMGEVKSVLYLGKNYEPKYRVSIPGVVSNPNRGEGFWESELLPYGDS